MYQEQADFCRSVLQLLTYSCGTIDAVVRMAAGYAATVRLTLGPLQRPPALFSVPKAGASPSQ